MDLRQGLLRVVALVALPSESLVELPALFPHRCLQPVPNLLRQWKRLLRGRFEDGYVQEWLPNSGQEPQHLTMRKKQLHYQRRLQRQNAAYYRGRGLRPICLVHLVEQQIRHEIQQSKLQLVTLMRTRQMHSAKSDRYKRVRRVAVLSDPLIPPNHPE